MPYIKTKKYLEGNFNFICIYYNRKEAEKISKY